MSLEEFIKVRCAICLEKLLQDESDAKSSKLSVLLPRGYLSKNLIVGFNYPDESYCSHYYHIFCVEYWKTKNNECPMCLIEKSHENKNLCMNLIDIQNILTQNEFNNYEIICENRKFSWKRK